MPTISPPILLIGIGNEYCSDDGAGLAVCRALKTKGFPGALGTERPLGQGSVGMERFIAKLKQIGYKNPLNIEREGVPDHQEKLRDIQMGVGLLQRLLT